MIDTPLLSNKVHQAARNVPTRSDQTWLLWSNSEADSELFHKQLEHYSSVCLACLEHSVAGKLTQESEDPLSLDGRMWDSRGRAPCLEHSVT